MVGPQPELWRLSATKSAGAEIYALKRVNAPADCGRDTSFAKGEADPSAQTEGGPRGGAPAGKRAALGATKDAGVAFDEIATKLCGLPIEGARTIAAWQWTAQKGQA